MRSLKSAASLAAATGLLFSGTTAAKNASSTSVDLCGTSVNIPFAPHISILNVSSEKVESYHIPKGPYLSTFVPLSNASSASFCNITVTYTHPSWQDNVEIYINLPLQHWNGKFLSLGGGGFSTNPPPDFLAVMASLGYASGATNGGHVGMDMSWALEPNTTLVNYPLLVDMASEALKDMTKVARSITGLYYSQPVNRTYWVGCSQGGRQGMMMAQRYSDLFDGILANAPAINWNDLLIGLAWPQVVIYESGVKMPACILDTFTNASIAVCNALDGLQDGIISNPADCDFDPFALVGQQVICNNTSISVNSGHASVAQQILNGPTYPNGTQMAPGYNVGTNLSQVLSTTCDSGACTGGGNVYSNQWITKLVAKNYDLDPLSLTYEQFYRFFSQGKQEYDWVIGTKDTDLRHLRDTNTKLLTFHGAADPLIPTENTEQYYRNALSIDSDAADYYRLFIAPGVGHCSGGQGPQPTAMLNVLEDWVENGNAPTHLKAVSDSENGIQYHRRLCLYPAFPRYIGGDPGSVSSFICSMD